jgi:hypothetical protein
MKGSYSVQTYLSGLGVIGKECLVVAVKVGKVLIVGTHVSFDWLRKCQMRVSKCVFLGCRLDKCSDCDMQGQQDITSMKYRSDTCSHGVSRHICEKSSHTTAVRGQDRARENIHVLQGTKGVRPTEERGQKHSTGGLEREGNRGLQYIQKAPVVGRSFGRSEAALELGVG